MKKLEPKKALFLLLLVWTVFVVYACSFPGLEDLLPQDSDDPVVPIVEPEVDPDPVEEPEEEEKTEFIPVTLEFLLDGCENDDYFWLLDENSECFPGTDIDFCFLAFSADGLKKL